MSAIAGVLGAADHNIVLHMLEKMRHRGEEKTVVSRGQVAIGHIELPTDASARSIQDEGALFLDGRAFADGTSLLTPSALLRRLATQGPEAALAGVTGGFTLVAALRGGKGTSVPPHCATLPGNVVIIARDVLGKKPLYLGYDGDKVLFSSEMKALVGIAKDIVEFPCGTVSTDGRTFHKFASLEFPPPEVTDVDEAVEIIRRELRAAVARQLPSSVSSSSSLSSVSSLPSTSSASPASSGLPSSSESSESSACSGTCGVFLSGGLDSSIIACLARELTSDLKFFSVGVEGSEDVARATELAEYLGVEHHVRTFSLADMEEVLPKAIYHMESYDAPLIRSCVPNYMVAEMASRHGVRVVLIGEGGDELFAGYSHLRAIEPGLLHHDLVDLLKSLHNTGLQRCDRMPMAWGVEARAPFLDERFVRAAMTIHPSLKIAGEGETKVEKWILRKAFEKELPPSIAWRKKQMFSQGAGSMHMLERALASKVSDEDVRRECEAIARWGLRNKEELHYFLVFRRSFQDTTTDPDAISLPPVGRTKVLYQDRATPDPVFTQMDQRL
ncbi:MAG: asparagine synthase-related protein [Firmicutes bacterium]|jgi:asparagine synthase (glutamine-hydrolysing)|nr:asparagine synthase-related protein [Bacillota bacterium]MDH7495300.1 asparagine synthase-related protein [Bacillota bacterium]